MPQKIYLNILKTGIYASFIIFFFVFKNLLFPFITSKQIPFNLLIEFLTIIWLVFIIKYPAWNPFKTKDKKIKNLITYGLLAFFAVLTLSCFTGVDFNLSFWGDAERMLGVFHLLHFLVFYFIIITVMRDWRDWKLLFFISLVACLLVILKSHNTPNRQSTIGNTTYISGLILFNIYFVFLLFFKEKKYKAQRWLYFLFLPFFLQGLRNCGTSGAYVGLGTSIVFFFLVYGSIIFINIIKNKSEENLEKRKKIMISVLAGLLISIGFICFLFANQENKTINKYIPIKEISVNKNTFQTRLISWKAAVKEFEDNFKNFRPLPLLLGTGHGNYAIVFDWHFQPTFYDHSRTETYFDRAHNNIIDIASTTGISGFLTYMSILVAVGFYLIKALKKGRIDAIEFSLLGALFTAYFVQNLAVFDSFVTYVSLMIILGYVYFIANTEEEDKNISSLLASESEESKDKEKYLLIIFSVIMVIIAYQYNILPLKTLKDVIRGQMHFNSGDLAGGIEYYKKAMDYETILDRDGRDVMARFLINNSRFLYPLEQQKTYEIISFAVDMMEKNIAYNPKDSLTNMQAARLYDVASKVVRDVEKRSEYSAKALEKIEISIAHSPGRIPTYFIKAQILTNQGNIEEAIAVLKYAKGMNEKYFETSCQLAQVYLIAEMEEEGFSSMDECLENGGAEFIIYKNALDKGIKHYAEKKDSKKLIMLYNHLLRFDVDNPEILIILAKLSAQIGDNAKAEYYAKKAAEIDKNLEKDVEKFIDDLGGSQ